MSDNKSQISMTEHLSALLDDEAGSFEERRVLDELKSDQVLSKKLANYALIGETMRTGESQQSALILDSSFLESIHDEIAKEDSFDDVIVNDTSTSSVAANSNNVKSPSLLRPIGGFAIAASFGALAFMGLQNAGVLSSPATQPSNIVESSGATAIVDTNSTTVNSISAESVSVENNNDYADADAKTRSMLKRYVDSHMQYATTSAFVPSVRVIAYTDNQ